MDKGINSTTENGEVISLDHYTYGLHPQELGHGIKAYSDEINKKYYESILEKVINSVNYLTVSKNGEVRICYISKEKAIISLVTPNGMDSSKRKGIFSHNIVINRQDYSKFGYHPGIFEKCFKRNVNLRGKIERLRITPVPKNEPSKPVEIPTSTLKNVLSTLLRGQGVKLICKNKDASTISKILYFILELLPETDRLVPYITAFPEKNHSIYKLIIMQEEEYMLPDKEWLVFDIDQEKDFSPKDSTDEAVNYMIDLYSKREYDGLKESHKLWHEIRQKNPDIELCSRIFSYEINIKENRIQSFLDETTKKPDSDDIIARCDFIIHRIKEVPLEVRREKFIILSMLKLGKSKGNFDGELTKIMDIAKSNFSKNEQIEITASLYRAFPNNKKILGYVKDYEKEPNIEFNEIIKKHPEFIDGLEDSKINDYIDDLPINKKIDIYNTDFKMKKIDEIVEIFHTEKDYISKYKKILCTLYEYINEPKYYNNEADDKVKNIIIQFVDALDKTVEKKFLGTTSKKKIPPYKIEQLISSKFLIILLFCLKHFNLVDYIKKLERVSKEYNSVIFSLNEKEIRDIFLKKRNIAS